MAYRSDEVLTGLRSGATARLEVAPDLRGELAYRSTWRKGDHYCNFVIPGNADTPRALELIRLAQQTHAEGYLHEQLVKPAAVDDNGLLCEMVDKSRSMPDIRYFLAVNPMDETDRATARIANVATVEDLPTYGLCKDGILPENILYMRDLIESGAHLGELAALAKSRLANSQAALELFRAIYYKTVCTNQVLYCSLVNNVYQYLSAKLSPANFQVIGQGVVLEENEFRHRTELVPLLIYPDAFVPNLVKAFQDAEDPRQKQAYLHSVLFMTEGAPYETIPPEVMQLRQMVTSMRMGSKALAG